MVLNMAHGSEMVQRAALEGFNPFFIRTQITPVSVITLKPRKSLLPLKMIRRDIKPDV